MSDGTLATAIGDEATRQCKDAVAEIDKLNAFVLDVNDAVKQAVLRNEPTGDLKEARVKAESRIEDLQIMLEALQYPRLREERAELMLALNAANARVQENASAWRKQVAVVETLRKELDAASQEEQHLRSLDCGRYKAQQLLSRHESEFPNISTEQIASVATQNVPPVAG